MFAKYDFLREHDDRLRWVTMTVLLVDRGVARLLTLPLETRWLPVIIAARGWRQDVFPRRRPRGMVENRWVSCGGYVLDRVAELLGYAYVASGQPFHEWTFAVTSGVAIIYLVAFAGRGALGFGAIAPAVTLSSFLIPPHHAVLLAVLTATVPQLQVLPEGIRRGDWYVARPAILALLISIPFGVWAFARIKSETFSLILGLVISIIVLMDTMKLLDRATKMVDIRRPSIVFGLAGATGFITGLAGAGGVMMLAVYLKHACRDYIALRATAALMGTILIFWRLFATVIAGLIDLQLVTESVLLVPVVYLGGWIGMRYFRRMGAERYYNLFQALLLLSAVGLMMDGLRKLV